VSGRKIQRDASFENAVEVIDRVEEREREMPRGSSAARKTDSRATRSSFDFEDTAPLFALRVASKVSRRAVRRRHKSKNIFG